MVSGSTKKETMKKFVCLFAMIAMAFSVAAENPKSFTDTIGPVSIQPVVSGQLTCPFMSWGSDTAMILAAQKGGIFEKSGVSITLYRQDDFAQQVKDYTSGKTPFLRGTLSSICLASEIVTSDASTKPVIVLFESWSLGDHFIAKSLTADKKTINNLNDFKKLGRKVKIAVQDGGAHVGMLYQILDTAGMTKNDVEFVWAKELAGKGSASEVFAKDATVDACFAITPDMAGLVKHYQRWVGNVFTSRSGSGCQLKLHKDAYNEKPKVLSYITVPYLESKGGIKETIILPKNIWATPVPPPSTNLIKYMDTIISDLEDENGNQDKEKVRERNRQVEAVAKMIFNYLKGTL